MYELESSSDPTEGDEAFQYPVHNNVPEHQMHEKAEIYNDGQDQNNAFREDEHGSKMVTVDQAFEICGGYGRFQKINATFLIICMGFSTCFLYSFAFLEV